MICPPEILTDPVTDQLLIIALGHWSLHEVSGLEWSSTTTSSASRSITAAKDKDERLETSKDVVPFKSSFVSPQNPLIFNIDTKVERNTNKSSGVLYNIALISSILLAMVGTECNTDTIDL